MSHPAKMFLLAMLLLTLGACATPDATPPQTRYEVVDVNRAKALYDRGALFVDLRVPWLYSESHIPGAVNLTWGRKFNPERLAEVAAKDREIVLYCYGLNCDLSSRATDAALSWGFTRVHYFFRGYPDWLAAGYPVES